MWKLTYQAGNQTVEAIYGTDYGNAKTN